MSSNFTSDEFIQKILYISRIKENELKNGKLKLNLTPYDVSYLQNVIEKGVGSSRISFILTPNDVESIKNLFHYLISFKVKSRPNAACGIINFKYLRSLQHLQLDKINPSQLKNLEVVRSQLKSLNCYQSLKCLKDLLRGPGQNIKDSFWSNLRYLDISFNNLEYFDDSLSLLSTMNVFNASHNHIKSSEGLKLLKDVHHLNLGYNKLVDFPSFSAQTCMSLTQLVLRYNFLESLTGIQYLVHLSELDLGCNLLQAHDCLVPLNELNNLTIIELGGNPLSFHKKHRILTCAHLNIFILNIVVLDGYKLSSKEIKESHLVQIKVSPCPIRNNSSTSLHTISGSLYQTNMIGSVNYSEEASHDSGNSDNESITEPIAKAYKKKIKKQKATTSKNVQELTLSQDVPDIVSSSEQESHIKTKELIQETRKELGAGWLLSASTFLGSYTEQTISGSLKSQVSETESTKFLANERVGKTLASCESPDTSQIPSSATESVSENVPEASSKELNTDDAIFNTNLNKNSLISYKSIDDESEQYASSESADETEVEANLFIVQNFEDGIDTQLILSVGAESMSEKDGLTGKHLHSWNLKSLISAQEIIEDERIFVQLEFDAMRKEKRERNYWVDDGETSQILLSLLEKHVEARNLQAITEGLTQCLKCNFEFQNENADRTVIGQDSALKEVNACPKCGSTLLVIIQSDAPIAKPPETIDTQPSSYTSSLKIIDFFQSLNSSKSLEDSGSMNRSPGSRPRSISSEMQAHRKALSLSPSNLDEKSHTAVESCSSSSVDCISLNTEESVPINSNKALFDRESAFQSESDITVLSNPSQSSIAVISTTSSSIEYMNPSGGLEVIPEQDLPTQEYSSLSIYDLNSMNDTFYSANLNSPVAKIKESSKSEQGLTSSGEISWYDSASAETFIQISQDTLKRTRTPDYPHSSRESKTIDESIEVEDESRAIWDELEEPCEWPSDVFSQLDHRIRLHFEVEIFLDGEELLATLKGSIATVSSNYYGMVIFSNKKIYFFKLVPGEHVQLSNLSSQDIFALKSVHTLLGSQGIALIFENATFVINFGYADLCNSFITFIEDILKTKLKVQNVVFEHSTEQDLVSVKNEVLMSDLISHSTEDIDVNVELFLLMTHIGNKSNVALILTENSLNLAEVQYFSQSGNYEIHFVLFEKQLLSSLMSLHLSEDLTTVGFHFLDEEENTKHYWLLEAQSKSSMASLLLILKKHWETLFLIQMQLSVVSKCLACGYDAECSFLINAKL